MSSVLRGHRGRGGGRDHVSGDLRLGRRIPSCRRCRIPGSARWGVHGTSVCGEWKLVGQVGGQGRGNAKIYTGGKEREGRTVSQMVT